MVTTALRIGTALLMTVASARAQSEFSGTWRLDEARSQSPGWAEYVRPVSRVIRIDADTVEIVVTQGTKTSTLRYPLTKTKPAVLDTTALSNRAYWEDGRLVTETVESINGQTVTMREESALDPNGTDLIVQRLFEVQHGYTLRGTKNNSLVRDTYVRVTP